MSAKNPKKTGWSSGFVLKYHKNSWSVFSLCYRRENLNVLDMRFKFSGSTFWVFGYKVPTC